VLQVIPVCAFVEPIAEKPHFGQFLDYRNETGCKIFNRGTMMARLVPSVHLFERGRNVGQREEELTINGSEEVLAALCGWVAEIEVIVEVRNASIVRVLLEVINSV
jgi:hypothetical protein